MDSFDSQKKKRFHRHTPTQIQTLESVFRECPHPDEKQRMHLSRELGLEPRQIKFWFQNRRTQKKAQTERADNSSLRSENERIRCENITMKEALRRVVCPNCGGPPISDDDYFDEERLRLENSHLKDELRRVSTIASRKLGTPIPHLSQVHRLIPMSSLSLSVGGSHEKAQSSDFDLLPFFPSMGISPEQRPLMADEASAAMEELLALLQADETLWKKSETGERETLDFEAYGRVFSRERNPNAREEASRAACVAMIPAEALVDVFMDSAKWMELFPTIISQARTIEVLSSGVGGRSGSLMLMYGEIQVLSPAVSPRELFFLRYCRQIDQRTWAIADVSRSSPSSGPHRKLPSGCVIQDVFNGFSKVTWVEHFEVEERSSIHPLYRSLVLKGFAFGAERWASSLRRNCERSAYSMIRDSDTGGGVSWEGKRSMMKLSERMVGSFCKSVFGGEGQRWSAGVAGQEDVGVRVAVQRRGDCGQPGGVVLSAATSVWLPSPPEVVFSFLSNERTRPQWDVLSSGTSVEEIAQISTGEDAGNSISLLRGLNAGESSMLILQESSASPSCSTVIYAPIDVSAINMVMNGEDPARAQLLPSGFAILPDEEEEASGRRGSLVTVAFQILVSSLPSVKMNGESIATVNNLISTTVRQIKLALNSQPVEAPGA